MKIQLADTCTGDYALCKGFSPANNTSLIIVPSQGVPPSRPLTIGTWDRTGQVKISTEKGGKQ